MSLDLEDIERAWLNTCGCCDAGLPTSCACPTEDPRRVIQDFVDEARRLGAEAEAARLNLRLARDGEQRAIEANRRFRSGRGGWGDRL